MPKILLLDDSPGFLADLKKTLSIWGYQVLAAETAAQAETMLDERPDFAIVDLFLAGDEGDELSNSFIEHHLVPRSIPYGRLTSAPALVPKEFSGDWVLHKYHYSSSPENLRELLLESLEQERS